MTGLGERGLVCPLLVISDGAPGLIGAVDRTMGAALRQRCLIHYADVRIMPMWVADPLQGNLFVAKRSA
ncbi:hypothetical protein WU83_32120 [Mycobacterium nebraskense]|nr:hypothetical protein WU83_32120 [Mycobacterium nebraskense]